MGGHEIPWDIQIAHLFQAQYALLTRGQALDCGMTPGAVDGQVRRGRWKAVHRTIYRLVDAPRCRRQDILAACLAAGPGTVASHRSAAWLWGLLPPAAMVLEVTVPATRCCRLEGVVVHRSTLPGEHPCRLQHIPVTSPVATIITLAAVAPVSVLHSVLDAAARRRLATAADVLAELDRVPRAGSPGVAALRQALAERGCPGIPASELERRMLALIRQYRLPAPARELPVGPQRRYRADFAYPDAGLLVEVDGFDSHGTPDALSADLRRQNELVADGWRVLRYTWPAVVEHPARVAAEIAGQLRRAEL